MVAGDGNTKRKFGRAESCLSLPTFVWSERIFMFVVDSGITTLNILTGINGMMSHISHTGQFCEAFNIHASALISLAGASQKMCNISKHFHEAQARVQEKIAGRREMQGPEGSCSSPFICHRYIYSRNFLEKLKRYMYTHS